MTLAFRGLGRLSRGTTLTGLEGIATGGLVRRDGKLIPVPMAWKTRRIDFGSGQGPIATMTVPWADVFTAYYTTGIPNIEVYMAFKPWFSRLAKSSRYFNWLLGSAPLQSFSQVANQCPAARSHGGAARTQHQLRVGRGA